MLAEERKNKILELISEKKIVKVTELSTLLKATEATVRRDLEDLQAQNKVHRVHGGATSVNPTSRMIRQQDLLDLCTEEKKRIARKAYDYVQDNDAIFMDSSTTVLELARLIAAGGRSRLTVITNSFVIVSLFADTPDIRVLHTGGQIVYALQAALGVVAENMIRGVKVEKCFLGTNGIDPSYGYSSPTFEEASIKRCMMHSSKQTFVLSDHTKFDEFYMCKFADFVGEVDYLITDALPKEPSLALYRTSVNLVLA
ncbi:DeoR/GlpR family DNA-binding transcription regulator [Oscillospiraceae bacterium MB08-C2-2]|nr:DeoR/GlpR family DNA-binding transcription regulator [Oscillospiraceae bacterium MB08-C2-2]